MLPAIILSGHTMALGVVRALAKMSIPIQVVYYEEKHFAQASRYVTGHYCAPHPELHESAFIDFLTGCSELKGGVLFPVSDATLVAVARHKAALSKKYIVACADWPVTRACIDKGVTYHLAAQAGLAVPKTLHVHSLQDVERQARHANYPCLLKPTESHRYYARFGRKMSVVTDAAELLVNYKEASDAGLDVVVQELIGGIDGHVVNYNCYIADGRAVAEFTAEHTRNGPPSFGSPRVAMSRWIPDVVAPGRTLLRALGLEGFACVEFKWDQRDGRFKLMEVNARHNLSTALAVRCGMNFPYIEYRHRASKRTVPVEGFARGIYWIDLLRDIGFSARHMREEKYKWRQLLAPYRSPHIYAILDRRDPMPFIRRFAYLASSAARTAFTMAWPWRQNSRFGSSDRRRKRKAAALGGSSALRTGHVGQPPKAPGLVD